MKVRKAGFVPIKLWPSCFWHPILKCYLNIYVDDFKLSGPVKNTGLAWQAIIAIGLDLGPTSTGDDVYLVCAHEQRTFKVDGIGY